MVNNPRVIVGFYLHSISVVSNCTRIELDKIKAIELGNQQNMTLLAD